MPIYEFKCSKCQEFFEVIVMGSNDNEPVCCPKCQSKEYERIVSKSSFTMGSSSSGQPKGVQTQERQCSTGSCKTYTIPGETR